MAARIFATIILLLSVLFMPYWVSILLALAGILYFRLYLEGVALLLLSDLLYGTKEAKFYGITYVSFVAVALIIVLVELVKKKLRFY